MPLESGHGSKCIFVFHFGEDRQDEVGYKNALDIHPRKETNRGHKFPEHEWKIDERIQVVWQMAQVFYSSWGNIF